MDLTPYFKTFKATKKVVEELNYTMHWNAVVEIKCKVQNIKVEELGPNEGIKFNATGKERILRKQPIVHVDRNKYGTLIKDYDREYLCGINTYPKTLQDTYNLLKELHKHEKAGQKDPFKVGVSFNTVGEEDGEALINYGTKSPKCSRYGCNSHTVDRCTAKYRAGGTMMHNMGEVEEADYETNNEVSAEMTTNEVSTEITIKYEDPRCHDNALIFIQPDVTSLMGRLNTSFKTVGISKNVDFTRQSIHN